MDPNVINARLDTVDQVAVELQQKLDAIVTESKAIRVEVNAPNVPTGDIRVRAGDNLQAAYDAAQPGQRLLLDPAGTWPTLKLNKKPAGPNVRITTENVQDFVDKRVTAAEAAGFAKIGGGPGPAVTTEPGGGATDFDNIQFIPSADTGRFSTVVYLGTGMEKDVLALPHDVNLRRVICVVDWTKQTQRRFIRSECVGVTLIDSRAEGFNKPGPDDANAFITTNSPGPFLVQNCFLEATAENLLFGGGDPQINGLVPGQSGTVIRRCHFFKPLAWKTATQIAGQVKNLFELKNAKNVLVEDCVFENVWTSGQDGSAIVLTVRNQDNSAPWSTVQDITFRNSRVIGTERYAVRVLGTDDTAGRASVLAKNFKFQNIESESGRGFYINRGLDGLSIEHWTAAKIAGHFLSFEHDVVTGLAMNNNLLRSGLYGIHSPDAGLGKSALAKYAPGYVWGTNAAEKSTNATTVISYPIGTTVLAAGSIVYDANAKRYNPLLNGADGLPMGADLSQTFDPR
jgi:hypothetical protein